MQKFLQTAGCCFFSFLLMLISQVMSNIIGSSLILMGFPAFIGIVVFVILYPLFTYFGIKLIIERIYSLDLQEIGIKKFSVRPVWCITALILPLVIISTFTLISGTNDLFPYDNITALLNVISLYISVVIPQEMTLCCVTIGIIRKNYNIKSAVIISSVIYSIINIAISNNLNSAYIIPVFITGIMSGMMFALVLIESGNFWNNVLINISVAMIAIAIAIIGIDFNDNNNAIKFSVISTIGYIIVNIIALRLIKKKENQNPEETEINEE